MRHCEMLLNGSVKCAFYFDIPEEFSTGHYGMHLPVLGPLYFTANLFRVAAIRPIFYAALGVPSVTFRNLCRTIIQGYLLQAARFSF